MTTKPELSRDQLIIVLRAIEEYAADAITGEDTRQDNVLSEIFRLAHIAKGTCCDFWTDELNQVLKDFCDD